MCPNTGSVKYIQSSVPGCGNVLAGLMIMASHQPFSGQIKHLSDQIKFGQTNLLYSVNVEVIEFARDNECLDNFQYLMFWCLKF